MWCTDFLDQRAFEPKAIPTPMTKSSPDAISAGTGKFPETFAELLTVSLLIY